tara:strand:- start:47 stop:574 length:528 start_codon:yes stop_codon:yes gene_type:complete
MTKWTDELQKAYQAGVDSVQIAGDPSFTVGGGQSSRKNKAIMKNADQNTPNAKDFMDKLNLGPSMFPIKKAEGGQKDELIAGRPANMPEYIYESIQRQYGNKKYGPYTIEDKINVINWYKKADAGGEVQNLANVWSHETPSDTFNRQNYPGRDASDELRIDHMRKYHDMKKKELA